jgi:hypothetical protein
MKVTQVLISLITLGLCLGKAQTSNTVVWTGAAGDGMWSNPTNWSTLKIPGNGDDVYITLDGVYSVTVTTSGVLGTGHLTLGGSAGTQELICNGALSMPVDVGSNAVVALAGGCLLGAVTNSGKILLQQAGSYGLSSPWLENAPEGLVDIQADALVGGSVIDNAGTFRKSGGTTNSQTTLIGSQLSFTNSGLLDVQAGTLYFNLDTSLNTFSSSGTINVANSAVLRLTTGTYSFAAANRFTGSGLCRLEGSDMRGVLNGTVTFRADSAVDFAAQLQAGTLVWNSGSSPLSGALTIGPNGLFNLVSIPTLQGTLTNQGQIVWCAGAGTAWPWQDNARLENQAGAVFDLQLDGDFTAQGTNLVVNNAGTFLKSGGAGTANVDKAFAFTNSGLLDLQSGTLSFAGSVNQNAGETRLAGGNVAATGGFNLDGGSLSGAGAICGALTNTGGTVIPGSPLGTITLTGNYSQGNDGTLNVEVGGRNNGQFGQLSVAGSANLNGALTVTLVNSFLPAPTDRFQILSCASRNGTFNASGLPAGVSINYSNTGVFLAVTGALPVQIVSPAVSGGAFAFSFATVSNQSYTIQCKDDLAATNWLYFTNFPGTGSLMQVVSPLTNMPRRFFRVRQP